MSFVGVKIFLKNAIFPKKSSSQNFMWGRVAFNKTFGGGRGCLKPPNIFMVSFHLKISNSEMFLNPLSLMRVSFDSEDHTLINSLLKAYQSVARWRDSSFDNISK
jgi:hypothetical protein